MLLRQKIKFRNTLIFFANKLKVFKIIWENLAINNFSKTLIILKKRIRYKLLRLSRITIVTTINSDEKTNNNSVFDEMLVKLFIFIKHLRTKEIKKIKDCKCYFINIDFLKQISCELRNKIKIYIKMLR